MTEIFVLEPYKLWTRMFVTTCDGAVPTTACEKGCSNGNHCRRQTQGMGRYGKVMSLGDKQGLIRWAMGIVGLI